jgi:hypothetical protein
LNAPSGSVKITCPFIRRLSYWGVAALICSILEQVMPRTSTDWLVLAGGCCAGALVIGLVLAFGSIWLSQSPRTANEMSSSPQKAGRTPTALPAKEPRGNTDTSASARTPDGRFIHPQTGRACPIDTKPTARGGCTPSCSEPGLSYWEDARRCIPVAEARTACEAKSGNWIDGPENEGGRCRVPLTEIDPTERGRLNRLGR